MGVVQRFLEAAAVAAHHHLRAATFALAWLGTHISHLLVLDHRTWGAAHPRLLLRGVAWCRCGRCCSRAATWAASCSTARSIVGVIGVFFGGYEIQQPAFKGFERRRHDGRAVPVPVRDHRVRRVLGLPRAGVLGHHVEADRARSRTCSPIGYGAMLAEGFVALIALVTIMIAAPGSIAGPAPGTIYGNGIGRFLTLVIGQDKLAVRGDLRRDGVLDLRVRHARRLHAARPLPPAGAVRLARARAARWSATARHRRAPGLLPAPSAKKGCGSSSGPCSARRTSSWPRSRSSSITVWLHQARQRIAFTLLPDALRADHHAVGAREALGRELARRARRRHGVHQRDGGRSIDHACALFDRIGAGQSARGKRS